MPIRPENRHFYTGSAFEALRDLLRARAENRCECCKAPNGERVFFADGKDAKIAERAPWYSEGLRRWVTVTGVYLDPQELVSRRSLLIHGPDLSFGRYVDVVCGVAHLDHDPRHQDPERCAWLCNRCHLAHDEKDNHARARRYAAQESGQLWLDAEIEKAAAPEAGGWIKLEARE